MLSNLKAALAARRMKQVDLALRVGIAPSVLSEIVHGRRRIDPGLAARIAEILQADPGWLFSSVTYIPAPKLNPQGEASAASTGARPGGS